jgi:hypothetical protein
MTAAFVYSLVAVFVCTVAPQVFLVMVLMKYEYPATLFDLYQCHFDCIAVGFMWLSNRSCFYIGSVNMDTKGRSHELEFAAMVLVLLLMALYLMDFLRII